MTRSVDGLLPQEVNKETSMQFDVVTIGGGFSGLTTACRAAELGLKVAVLEARTEDLYPCSSRYSTGVCNVMGLPILLDPKRLFDAIMTGSGGAARPEVARAVAENGKRTVDWLRAEGARFIQKGLQKDQPGQQVLAPPRRLSAGLDWEGRGGDVLMRRFEENLARRGGVLLRGTKVVSLIVEGGACAGVEVLRGGQLESISANAVAVADGGFAANRDMIGQYITPRADRVLCRVGPGAMGEGIRVAEAAGAAVGGFGAFYGHVHHRNAMSNPGLWPYPHLDAVAEVGILVGSRGERFCDEGLGGVCMANAIARLADPLSAWLVIDDAMWRAEPSLSTTVAANPSMVSAGGELTSASSIEALARSIGMPPIMLARTVQEHDQAIAKNDFSRVAVARSFKQHRPMPFLVPPYHAVPLCAGITGTMGGIVIDEHAQARKPDGSAFAGLYAVGTPVAGLEGGPRAGYVGGLSKAFILGLLAAEHMAEVKGRSTA
jgi:fumarate reductase flavoprotein subunit